MFSGSCILYYFLKKFYWNIDDLPCCISFRCTSSESVVHIYMFILSQWVSQVALAVKKLPASAGDKSSIPESRRFPWRRACNPLQYSGLENLPWTEEPGELSSVGSQSRTRLKWFSMHILSQTQIGYWSEVAQSCPILCDPMDCSLTGSSIHGIFQTRILEWVAISFSRRFSQPRDWTQVSCLVGRHFTIWATLRNTK